MKRVAIVSEYDPFHNGHKYQTDMLRKMGAECIVSILGGTFSQRGNCHIADKYFRAEAAVTSGGCDLVLELPYPYSCSSAEYFARAGVRIAAEFCDSIAFGCETEEPELLCDIARFTCSDPYKLLLDDYRRRIPDISMPRVNMEIIKDNLSEKHANEAVQPNNILCIEYLRAIYSLGYRLEPVFIKRFGADHDSKESCGDICSASLVRDKIKSFESWQRFCPDATSDVMKKASEKGLLGASLSYAEKAVIYTLRNISPEHADLCAECGGGLGRRILNMSSSAGTLSELYDSLATKRYTNARIRRAVISLLTGATEADEKSLPEFTCMLASNKSGLSVIKKSQFPVISTISDIRALDCRRMTELYINAEKLFSLCYERALPEYAFFSRRPVIMDK